MSPIAAAPARPRQSPFAQAGIALRALAVVALLSALAPWAQDRLVDALMPWWRASIPWLDADFRVVTMVSATDGARSVVEVQLTPARYVIVGQRVVPTDERALASSTTPRGGVWLLLTVFLAVLCAWPASRGWREGAARLLIGLPLLGLLLVVDLPLTLLGPVRSVLIEQLDPEGWHHWVWASEFLRGGGRYLLAGAGAAFACLAARSGPVNAMGRLA